ncbi:MAG: DNA ligase D [Planctomycetaceae bacterium]
MSGKSSHHAERDEYVRSLVSDFHIMSLLEYQRKRDFRRTPEPKAKVAKGKGWSFVIQKHAASHLHYDFRLELDGVLKSWAVPKGPSLDPKVKRLAMHVEDHPVKYGQFEGIIPEGEYGGGTVMLWDRGTWEPVGDPHEGYRAGRLKFQLHGEKLQGGWMLVRTSRSTSGKGNEWLLFKECDEMAKAAGSVDIVDDQPLSVASGRDLDQIASDRDNVWGAVQSNGAATKAKPPNAKKAVMANKTFVSKRAASSKKAAVKKSSSRSLPKPSALEGAVRGPMPRQVDAKLATLATNAPEGDEWFHEIKFDGYRMLCRIDKGRATFASRNHKSWTKQLQTLADACAKIPVKQAILDGEVVVFKADGTTDFQSLQNAFSEGRVNELVYCVFDLLYCDGIDLQKVALEDRKALLEKLLPTASAPGPLRYSEHFVGNGPKVFKQSSKLGLEGIISKRRDRPYSAGRSLDWLKVKHSHREEFVIGGFTDPGAREGFGALLLGYHNADHEFVYAGKVGTGFSDALLKQLRSQLNALSQQESPFSDLRGKTGDARGAHWVHPQLVAQVSFSEWTRDGHLRHPSFLGLRDDKPAKAVIRDKALEASELKAKSKRTSQVARSKTQAVDKTPKFIPSATHKSEGLLAGVRLTSPEKVLFSDGEITKLDLAQYYLSIADWILPHVANRPLSLVRCPEGAEKECFFQKHPGVGTPKTFRLIPVKEKSTTRNYLLVDTADDLVSLAQIGALEIHVWGSKADKLESPDRLIFDLDPDPSVKWPRVVESAHQIRAFLDDLGLRSFVKTTGGKGLHIVIPLQRRHDWDEVKAFSKQVAEIIEQADPQRYTCNMSKAARGGKIFIDYHRNGRSATAIAAYSTRAKAGATVSVPLSWEELTPDIRSDSFTIQNLPERLRKLKKDPWAEVGDVRQSLTQTIRKRLGKL